MSQMPPKSPAPTFDPEALATCTYCPRLCRDVCPPALGAANEALIPTHKIGLLELWQKGLLPLDQTLASTFYACTDCGACTTLCKHQMQPATILYKARTAALDNGFAPPAVDALLQDIKEYGNPYGHSQITENNKSFSTALFLGCATCANAPAQSERLLEALRRATGTQMGIFSPGTCCGAPLAATGAEALHQEHKQGLSVRLHPTNHLIVSDPHCLRHLQNQILPAQANHQDRRISHVFAILASSLPALGLTSTPEHQQPLVYYHDSAALGRHLGIYDEPRRILAQLGYQVAEFTRHREKAMATGAGGIFRWTSPQDAHRYVNWLVQEVRDAARYRQLPQPPPIVTLGETERSHLAQAAPDLQILDLNELLVDAILQTPGRA